MDGTDFTFKRALVLVGLFFVSSACASRPVRAETPESPAAAPAEARDRYGLRSTDQKLVDDRGEGHENLYGVRNLRPLLASTFYRGGANNRYNRYGARDNRNPLPTIGLENLCREGFDTAIYLYSNNFETAPKKVDCVDRKTGKPNALAYLQLSPYNEKSIREILWTVYRKVKERSAAPAYIHCWNGWHASGLISAYTLRQFCGVKPEEAVAYWNRNTDGNDQDPTFEKLRQSIRTFVPYPDLKLSADERASLCLPLGR